MLLAEICWHYYANEMTQSEIAKRLKITRLRVNKAIQRAKEIGMVQINLTSPFISRIRLQEKIQETFNIKKVIVAPANRENYDYHTPSGTALAEYLAKFLPEKPWKNIGISWGKTLLSAHRKMKHQNLPDLEFISMLGGTSEGAGYSTFGITTGFAEVLGANYSLLAAPIFLSKGVNRENFLSQQIYIEHFNKFACLDAAIITASNVSSKSYLIQNSLPDEVSESELIKSGAVGDVNGIFMDCEGNEILTPLSDRVIGISLEQLQKVPECILVAAGEHKVPIIKAAIKLGLANVLITDDITAEKLLE